MASSAAASPSEMCSQSLAAEGSGAEADEGMGPCVLTAGPVDSQSRQDFPCRFFLSLSKESLHSIVPVVRMEVLAGKKKGGLYMRLGKG